MYKVLPHQEKDLALRFGWLYGVLLCALGFWLSLAQAHADWQEPVVVNSLSVIEWARVSDDELAAQRGGIIRRDGFELALGIERSTAVNGEVVARTVLMDSVQKSVVPTVTGGVHIRNTLDGLHVQNLQGSHFHTIIQNQISGQRITNQTKLNVDLAGLNLRHIDLRRLLDAQSVQGLRGY